MRPKSTRPSSLEGHRQHKEEHYTSVPELRNNRRPFTATCFLHVWLCGWGYLSATLKDTSTTASQRHSYITSTHPHLTDLKPHSNSRNTSDPQPFITDL
ncbi:hypothetical protein E2C01_048668 [Portunus trituberculatus]|uniref:Uncharacterized protein n=1 Tax=Portunus trituberculatus TaxID=210409 RepID=A0A5B7GBR1_PORTR|nr:hypothetical protein [Portunus trituberculatus]